MKKIVFFLFLVSNLSYGQSLLIEPPVLNVAAGEVLKTPKNALGYIHISQSPGGGILGTIIKDDGPYLQSFNNKPLYLQAGQNKGFGLAAETNGDVTIANYTKMGLFSPRIQYKKITGYTAKTSPGGCVTAPHYLDATKIISLSIILRYESVAGQIVYLAENTIQATDYTPGISVSYNETDVYICIKILNNLSYIPEYKLLITYQE
jgi:hypothetical protein